MPPQLQLTALVLFGWVQTPLPLQISLVHGLPSGQLLPWGLEFPLPSLRLGLPPLLVRRRVVTPAPD